MGGIVVSDTGPLISLETIPDGFAFLRKMADRVLIPRAVLLEVDAKRTAPASFLRLHHLTDLVEVISGIDASRLTIMPGARPLHQGELEALALAMDRKLPILLEDADARRFAKSVGLTFVGIGGLILAAAQKSIIDRPEALRMLDALMVANRLPRRLRDTLAQELP
jgi:predicted nucleic acid-binding protein